MESTENIIHLSLHSPGEIQGRYLFMYACDLNSISHHSEMVWVMLDS